MNSGFSHLPVLMNEVLEYLQPQSGGIYLDGTVGGGNHAAAILDSCAPQGFLLALDQDSEALAAASHKLQPYSGRFQLLQGNFLQMQALANSVGISSVDGILLDIGVSSPQLDNKQRGFSYMQDAPLDMRMNQAQELTAKDVINSYTEQQLTQILFAYGEEKWAKRIAQFIVARREQQPFSSTGQLVEVIKQAIPKGAREKDQHPAKRTFQAIRIEVNGELEALKQGLDAAIELLKPQGRLVVISFHSLEDRIVKEKFKLAATNCICPPRTPVCTCGHRASIKILTKKPVTASEQELTANPRSRSALLRAAVKL